MSVQMHRMHLTAVIVDVHDHDVALPDHVHRHIGIEMPIDRPPQSRDAAHEARPTADRVVEMPGRFGGIEPQRGRASIAQQIKGGRQLRWCWRITATKNDSCALGYLDTYWLAVARHSHSKISPAASGDCHGMI